MQPPGRFPFGGNYPFNTQFNQAPVPGTGNGNQIPPHHQPLSNRFQRLVNNEDSGANARRVADFFNSVAPQRNAGHGNVFGADSGIGMFGASHHRFFDAIERELAGPTQQYAAYPPSHATSQQPQGLPPFNAHSLREQIPNIMDAFQSSISARFRQLAQTGFGDGEARSRAIFDYQEALKAYVAGGRTGTPPPVPGFIPSHLHPFISQLDPFDHSFGHELEEMVNNAVRTERQTRDNLNNIIGTAPRPDPRHNHHHDGNAFEPEFQPDGQPEYQTTEAFEPPGRYQQAPDTNRPSTGNAPDRRATVEDVPEEPPHAGNPGASSSRSRP